MITRRLLPLTLAAFGACTGTDVGNPPRGELTRFDTTSCKRGIMPSSEKDIQPVQDWMPDPYLYSGLSCVLWELDDDVLHVRLINHRDGCAFESQWEPRIATRAAGIDIALDRTNCIEAACIGCLYDLAFDVRLPDALQSSRALELRVLGDTCHTDEPRVHDALSLALSGASSGARCSYLNGGTNGWTLAHLGEQRLPCGNYTDLESRSCSSGVCTEVEPSRHLCLSACSGDADCQPSDVTACIDGVCQLRPAVTAP